MRLGRTRKSRAFLYALAIHGVVLIVLLTRMESKSESMHSPTRQIPIIKAQVVDQQQINKEKKRRADEAEAERAAAQEIRRNEARKIAAAKQEKERREKAKLAEQRLEKQRVERERVARDQQQAHEEAEKLAAALHAELEDEELEFAAAAQQRADESEISRYIQAIRSRVASVFIYPDLAKGLNCTLYVRMIPGGEVVEASVIQSSGNAAFDRQAENAVRKAAPLPVPSDPRLFQRMREINFVFDPEH
jgi:colicin import membrane protein